MKPIQIGLTGSAALLLTAVAVAHHVGTPLSYVAGPDVLSEVVYVHDAPVNLRGFPAYALSLDEHQPSYALTDGATFKLADAAGNRERVVFRASDFADIGAATLDEIVAAINGQITLARASEENSYLVLRGLSGAGPQARVTLQDGDHSPLEGIRLAAQTVRGQEDLTLVLSIPAEDPYGGHDGEEPLDLAHHPYLLLMSSTDGEFHAGGFAIPIGRDLTTSRGLRLVQAGVLPTFQGQLDDNADATAVFDTSLLELMFAEIPDEVYFAYLVFSMDGGSIEFVSNRFTLHVQ